MVNFRGPDNALHQLKGGQPFVLYWQQRNDTWLYPLGLWSGKDMMPKESISRDEVLVFRIDGNDTENLYASNIPGRGLRYHWGSRGWEKPVQRKGQQHYFAHTGSSNSMTSIQNASEANNAIRLALRMNISGAGDSWISDEQNTGSIRMQDNSSRASGLVAVRYGTGFDDALGSEQVLQKRLYSDLVGRAAPTDADPDPVVEVVDAAEETQPEGAPQTR